LAIGGVSSPVGNLCHCCNADDALDGEIGLIALGLEC